jgi:hypothetical protein
VAVDVVSSKVGFKLWKHQDEGSMVSALIYWEVCSIRLVWHRDQESLVEALPQLWVKERRGVERVFTGVITEYQMG